jgi:enhancing lycopene biosynthesis protein 2
MSKFAVILSGCGQHDGSETHEVILTLLAMDQQGIEWEAFAPDINLPRIVNHVTEEESSSETRKVLEESARLVRGKIKPLSLAKAADYDAIVFPGGIGSVSVLCDWYDKKSLFSFNLEVKFLLDDACRLKKPLGFICIAPMMITKIYKDAIFTIGNDESLALEIEKSGCTNVICKTADIVVDKKNKLVSTPANMLASGINEVYQGISKLIKELVVLG